MPAFVIRNLLLATGFAPRIIGNQSILADGLAMTGAFALAYPFELARVLIVN